ncbi:hypothetical protein DVA67_010800 [Solirubrobacter sp. CPCC 204708]|uniref:Calcium-binding protein n=1 Tax=Solirubrobacter deserti TaxID=2282478 RepID=A0ABT4RUE3_9ACTN|nr:calcium-binding protein [Solirubrobacter deserti]MBE2316466.1 hypothetical protein [Solirubrobacter deserti]MDA0142156.1 hypothetical protein [Solirubrobacter deserti]
MPHRLLRGAALGAGLVSALAIAAPAMATYSANLDGSTLRVTGDGASDKLVLATDNTTVYGDVSMDGTIDFTFPRASFTAVHVTAGGGDDEFRVQGMLDGLTVDGGTGDDALFGGYSADTLIAGPGNDLVDGNFGPDVIALGSGNDTFQWDPGDSNDTVAGDSGTDTFTFNGTSIAEDLRLSANGADVRFTRNIANITTELAAFEQVDLRAAGGADTVTVGALTGIRTVAVAVGDSDAATDQVLVHGTAGPDRATLATDGTTGIVDGLAVDVRATGMEPADTVTAALLGGDDAAAASASPTGTVQVGMDGGEGADTATYAGSSGEDAISVARNGTPVAAFAANAPTFNVAAERLVVKGGDGDDALYGLNGIGGLTELTLEGGSGSDTMRGGDGADTLLGGTGDDRVDSSFGADTLRGGPGDDRLQWDPGDGSDIVEGDSGTDTLDFNGSSAGERISLAANGPRVSVLRSISNVTLDMDNVEAAAIRALAGADDVAVGDLTGSDLKSVAVDLAAFDGTGDTAIDRVVATGTEGPDRVTLGSEGTAAVITGLKPLVGVTGAEPQDSVTAALLGGDDRIASSAVPTGEARVDADGGPGVDTATYTGTGDGDELGVTRDSGEVVRTYAAGAPQMGVTAVEELVVKGGEANDTIGAAGNIAQLTRLTADGGNGEDVLRGGNGDDVLLGGNGDDVVDGNSGADTARLGAGNDRFVWDPGDGSDAVDGQSGTDVQAFNGSNAGEAIAITAAADRHVRVTRSLANIAMDLANVEEWSVRALGGADTVDVHDLSGTPLKIARVDLAGFGGTDDAALDTVNLDGTDKPERINLTRDGGTVVAAGLPTLTYVSGSEPTRDTLHINTLEDDWVWVGPGVRELIRTSWRL